MNYGSLLVGLVIVIIGISVVLFGLSGKTGETKFGVGGFIGPIPFGFGNSPRMVGLAIGLSVAALIIFLVLRFVVG